MAYILKYKPELFCETPVMLPTKCGGELKIAINDEMGNRIRETPWIPNTILDGGLTHFGQYDDWLKGLSIGSSGVGTTFGMTGLQGTALGTGNSPEEGVINTTGSAPNYEISTTEVVRLTNQSGTIQEVVIYPSSSDHSQAYSNSSIRVVISPGIPVTSGQTVDVWYKFIMYPLITDTTGTVDISGVLMIIQLGCVI